MLGSQAAGYFGVATAAVAWYVAAAQLTNEVYRRVSSPLALLPVTQTHKPHTHTPNPPCMHVQTRTRARARTHVHQKQVWQYRT